MINTSVRFCGETKEKVYKDPLNTPILQAASYSSEVGTAIIEIAPRLGTALWAPSLMYLGADIYDKYKNDKTEFNPSAKRAFERAVYQGVFNLAALPLLIFLGQKIVSPFGRLTKDGISTNAKDAVFKHTKEVIEQCEGENFDDIDNFKKILKFSLINKIKANKQEKQSDNLLIRLFNFCTDKYSLSENKPRLLLAFADKNADKLFTVKNSILLDEKDKVPQTIMKKYKKIIPHIQSIYGTANTHSALKTALKEYQNMNIFQNKILKTVGGFISIICFAKPAGNFIEKIIVNKYVDYGINGITQEFIHNSYLKNIFNEMDRVNTEKAISQKATKEPLLESERQSLQE